MYNIASYGDMIADAQRTRAYTEALQRVIKPGAVVLDIGTGPGYFAFVACQLGARRVYAIEPAPAIQVAREIAAANGLEDRVVFIEDLSTNVTLPEPADVVNSDMRGVLPLYQRHIPSIIDARERLLAPGGVQIPRSDSLWVAVVDASERYGELTDVWNGHRPGIDMEAGRRYVTNSWRNFRATPEQLFAPAARWVTLDYRTIQKTDVIGSLEWTASRSGTAHGLLVWFEADLMDGVAFSNAPSAPAAIYGQAFFPWTEPVDLAEGDRIEATLEARLIGDDYVWRWDTRILASDDERRVKASFRQSSFHGVPLTPASLRKQALDYRPQLNERGEAESAALAMMRGELTLDQIGRSLQDRFPDRFPLHRAAVAFVCDLSRKYSR